jgi:hypothetical protein
MGGAFFWFIAGGSALAVVLATAEFLIGRRRRAFFGAETHRLRDLSGLPSTGAIAGPFGTESHQIRDLSELTPTEAEKREVPA